MFKMKAMIYIPKDKEKLWKVFKLLCKAKGLKISETILLFIEAWVEIEAKKLKQSSTTILIP